MPNDRHTHQQQKAERWENGATDQETRGEIVKLETFMGIAIIRPQGVSRATIVAVDGRSGNTTFMTPVSVPFMH